MNPLRAVLRVKRAKPLKTSTSLEKKQDKTGAKPSIEMHATGIFDDQSLTY